MNGRKCYNLVKPQLFRHENQNFIVIHQKDLINMNKRILIVDDEADICEILQFNLEQEGYEVSSSLEPLPLDEGNLPDLIILDVMMTPKSGFDWAQELKTSPATADIPIIFCTAKSLEEDLLKGFSLGSDDYICKPFRINEVKARVKAVLRRSQKETFTGEQERNGDILVFEGIQLNNKLKKCKIDGVDVPLTKLEFELLAFLLSHPRQVFSRDQILKMVWSDDIIVLDRTVDVNITRIRKKLGKYGFRIKTRFGYGYFFDI